VKPSVVSKNGGESGMTPFRDALLAKLDFSYASSDLEQSESQLYYDSVKERNELESIRQDQSKFKKDI